MYREGETAGFIGPQKTFPFSFSLIGSHTVTQDSLEPTIFSYLILSAGVTVVHHDTLQSDKDFLHE